MAFLGGRLYVLVNSQNIVTLPELTHGPRCTIILLLTLLLASASSTAMRLTFLVVYVYSLSVRSLGEGPDDKIFPIFPEGKKSSGRESTVSTAFYFCFPRFSNFYIILAS